jgi:Fe-S-cluster containining protein
VTIQDNPCLRCAVDQKCCKVPGLKLSKREFENLFQKHSSRLSVIKYNKIVILYPKDDLPCPYWKEDGCNIYQDRPIDCRLFPYELNQMVEKRGKIEVVVYDQTDCPQKESLFIPFDKAKELIETLAQDVYGQGKPIEIHYEPGKKPPRAFGIFNPLVARLSKIIRSYKERNPI